MVTLKEYLEQNKLTPALFARQIGVYDRTIRNYMKGSPAKKDVHTKLVELGIDHPLAIEPHLAPRKNTVKKEDGTKIKDRITKEQVERVKSLGNTIISKKFSKAEIIKRFKKEGLTVSVRNFENVYPEDDTHYVVTLLKEEK